MQGRGGRSTQTRFGVPYNEFRGQSKHAAVRQWLRRYGLQLTGTFSLHKYREELARAMATFWVAKMTCYYTSYLRSGQEAYIYTEEDVRSFAEPASFGEAYASADAPARRRMDELRALAPEAPVA